MPDAFRTLEMGFKISFWQVLVINLKYNKRNSVQLYHISFTRYYKCIGKFQFEKFIAFHAAQLTLLAHEIL